MNTKNLIPKDKFDIETAEKLKNYTYEELKPIIPNLLEWLQDINWPVSRPVSEYLITIEKNITDEILEILNSKDEVWKYWIISIFGKITNDERIIKKLFEFVNSPTEEEIKEEVSLLSKEIIKEKIGNKNILLEILAQIPDPEIPVINIVELGIVRDTKFIDKNSVEIIITPTYSACPAMFNIEEDIIKLFKEKGIFAKVTTQMFPIWTTDWMTDEAREKLRNYGIVPPEKGAEENHLNVPKKCPRCGSENTKQISRFGSTLCKASYQCNDCLEPFDYFKCH